MGKANTIPGKALPWIGGAAGLAYWGIESFVHVVVFGHGTVRDQLIPLDAHEIWTRILVLVLFVGFGALAGVVIRQRERSRDALRQLHSRLGKKYSQRTRELERQAAELARHEERDQLAAELHDSVTQTLFTAGLIADALPRLWRTDPESARRGLPELGELIREAQVRTRSLMLERHPEELDQVRLDRLLRRLGDSFSSGGRLGVELHVEGDCPTTCPVNGALYRIAGEALANAAKHSGAGHAEMTVHAKRGHIEMRIIDRGRGFEKHTVPADSVGLRIMRERAAAAGVALDVESRVGIGTRVTAVWDAPSLSH